MKTISLKFHVIIELIILINILSSSIFFGANYLISLILYFLNLIYIQILNFKIAKEGDEYIRGNYPHIYYKYYCKFDTYPNFIAARLVFDKSTNTDDIKTLKRQALCFLIFSFISLIISTILIIISRELQ